jgi:hypothetical protein
MKVSGVGMVAQLIADEPQPGELPAVPCMRHRAKLPGEARSCSAARRA